MQRHLYTFAISVASLAVLAGTAAPADARPPNKPGPVSNLTATATKPGTAFDVHATWTAGTHSTKYGVRLSSAGVTVDSGMVTTTSWTGHTTVADGSTVTVTVTSYNGSRKGPSVSKNLILPDLTAPVGSYTVVREVGDPTSGIVTIQRDSLSDNLTTLANINQTIDWGDGSGTHAWPSTQLAITKDLTNTLKVYYVTVTVKDQANNSRAYPLTVVVRDTQAPTSGVFTVSTHNAWASWTKVSLTQVDVTDNLSADDKLSRVIAWGDGSESAWAQGATVTHRYAAAGAFVPSVKLTDEAGNTSTPFETASVVVVIDTVKPTIKVLTPTTGRARVASWRVLKGTASDAQTGVRQVQLRVIEKRGTTWYAYNGTTGKWAKAATKAKAWAKAVSAVAVPKAGAWQKKVLGLTKGTLLFKARAVDNVSNASGWVLRKDVLTKR
jgi:5'-nucleotidase